MLTPTLRLTATLVASALVTGCYASSVVDEASSGSRLRARYWVPASGERSFAGWFDTELDRECGFVWLEDGGYRCLPLWTARPGPTYYADAACTEPVVEVIPESPCGSIERDFMYELVERREECTGGAQLRFYELEGRCPFRARSCGETVSAWRRPLRTKCGARDDCRRSTSWAPRPPEPTIPVMADSGESDWSPTMAARS